MRILNKEIINVQNKPTRIIQFGEGNFLRAFCDYMIQLANDKAYINSSITILKPIQWGTLEQFKKQDNLYTVELKGLINGQAYQEQIIVDSVNDTIDCINEFDQYMHLALSEDLRFVISNTTEAGIKCDENDCFEDQPAISFPAKLTQFLYKRAQHFDYQADKGLIMLPVELIDNNGDELKKCVLQTAKKWNLDKRFLQWIADNCYFSNTLVDRIVTGYPKGDIDIIERQLGYQDKLLVQAEPFALWVIESDGRIESELPLDKALSDKAQMDVIFTKDAKPYKQRKVRILNGAHTGFALLSYLKGNDTVLQSMEDIQVYRFFREMIEQEVIPTCDLPKDQLMDFLNAVDQRFKNPFIKHELLSIALNSVSKWIARCYPSLEKCLKMNVDANKLMFSLASLLAFYRGSFDEHHEYYGMRDGLQYLIKDNLDDLQFFNDMKGVSAYQLVDAFAKKHQLKAISDNVIAIAIIANYYQDIVANGMESALKKVVKYD